jgi:hypothetical protein
MIPGRRLDAALRMMDVLREHGPRVTRADLCERLGVDTGVIDSYATTLTELYPALYEGDSPADEDRPRVIRYYGLLDGG